MRDFLKGLDLDKDIIDSIMAEHGKLITEAKEHEAELTTKVKSYEAKIQELSDKAKSNEDIQKELESLKKQNADRNLNDKIIEALGNKKFVNDFTKKAIIDSIKEGLDKEENKGKSIENLLEEITENKEGIFITEETEVPRATGVQNKNTTSQKEDGVMAILKAKHPDIEF